MMAPPRATALPPAACLLAAAVVLAAFVASASAQSGGCTTTLISLYPCLNYISGNVSTPPASCCSSLGSVVQSNPQCLCAALSGDSSALGGISIDKDRALQLPKACNVQTPPASRCNSAGGGGGSAPGAATPTAPSRPSGASTGSAETGSGSKATPTSPYLASGGASLRGAASLAIAFAAVALHAVSAV